MKSNDNNSLFEVFKPGVRDDLSFGAKLWYWFTNVYWYHFRTITLVALFGIIMLVILIGDIVNRPNDDIGVIVAGDTYVSLEQERGILEYLRNCVDDVNDDGEITVAHQTLCTSAVDSDLEGDDLKNAEQYDEFVELEGKAGNFTSIDLGNFLAGALCKISKSLIANTDIDLENKVIEIMSQAVARFMEHECLIGTDGKVAGLRGVTLGVTAGSATVITAEELIKLKNKVKKQFRKGAKWIMSNDTLTAIELLKDGEDRFIFRDDMSGEFDGYILGYPVEVSDNMPEIATKKDVIYFGDFSGLALKQRDDALEMLVLREKFATQHAIGINAWLEFDAKVENAQKIAKLTMA